MDRNPHERRQKAPDSSQHRCGWLVHAATRPRGDWAAETRSTPRRPLAGFDPCRNPPVKGRQRLRVDDCKVKVTCQSPLSFPIFWKVTVTLKQKPMFKKSLFLFIFISLTLSVTPVAAKP